MTNLTVKINRLYVVAGLAAVLVLAVVGFVLLRDSKELRYPTQAELRGSLGPVASDELRRRGISLGGSLRCADIQGWSKLQLRAGCHGSTADKRAVQVIGTGEDRTKTHNFTILVDGRPVVENARCLGADCQRKS